MTNLLREQIALDSRLTRAQRNLMELLASLVDPDGTVRAKVEEMADGCIYCDRQVQRILRQLEASDRLQRLNQGICKAGEPNHYAFYPKQKQGRQNVTPNQEGARQNVTPPEVEGRQNVTPNAQAGCQNVTPNRDNFAASANSPHPLPPLAPAREAGRGERATASPSHARAIPRARADLELINNINSDQQQIARAINPKDQQQQQQSPQHAREDHAYARAMREWQRNHGEAKPVVVDELFTLYQRYPQVFEDALKEALRDNKVNGHPPVNFVRKILERKDRERVAQEKRAEALRAPAKTPSYALHNDPHRQFQDFIHNGRKGETLHEYQTRIQQAN